MYHFLVNFVVDNTQKGNNACVIKTWWSLFKLPFLPFMNFKGEFSVIASCNGKSFHQTVYPPPPLPPKNSMLKCVKHFI